MMAFSVGRWALHDVTIAVFATLAAIDSRLNAWLARRRCVVCGSAANRRGRLRFDRLHSMYRSVHIDCQRWLPPGTTDRQCSYEDCHHNHPELAPHGGNAVSTDGVMS